ncbi:hypothetical protein LCGC14_0561140 [marine sediment metagenome]|uniref:Uncharacterized protein n=1 Tax=marine sediment metagenome TaxID=412755 RepID=A0A0F9UV96_9ZZZZ
MEKWKIRENTPRHIADNNTEIIIEGSGAAIARMNDGWDNPTIQANAERIVKAVNSFDDMYEALKAIDGYLSASFPANLTRKKSAVELLDKALAKAEGK